MWILCEPSCAQMSEGTDAIMGQPVPLDPFVGPVSGFQFCAGPLSTASVKLDLRVVLPSAYLASCTQRCYSVLTAFAMLSFALFP